MSKVIFNQLAAPHQSYLLKYNPSTNTWGAYASVAEANATIPAGKRHLGLQALIGTVLYHYAGGIGDGNLVAITGGGGGGVAPITGSTAVDFTNTFSASGLLRDAVFSADAPGSFTLRQNEDPNTDFEIQLGVTYPVSQYIGMPLYSGAKIQILNPTATITYTFYLV